MIVFVVWAEGEIWTQMTSEEAQARYEKGERFTALKVGNYIYDFVLESRNKAPIRYMPAINEIHTQYRY